MNKTSLLARLVALSASASVTLAVVATLAGYGLSDGEDSQRLTQATLSTTAG